MEKSRKSECRVQPATLGPGQIAALRKLESQLGGEFCLLAVKSRPLYVLEAKTGPNLWQDIETVYPQDDLPAFYSDKEAAGRAKSTLKTLLLGRWQQRFKKYPIRVRQLSGPDDA